MISELAVENWSDWQTAYLDWFDSLGIDTVAKYIAVAQGYESESAVKEIASSHNEWEAIQQMGRHGFSRVPANLEQDIAIIGINPRFDSFLGNNKLPTRADTNKQNQSFDLNYRIGAAAPGEVQEFVPETTGAGLNWLLHKQGSSEYYIRQVFEALVDSEWIPFDIEELFRQSPKTDQTLLKHFYYTNWFKYATKSGGNMHDIIDLTESTPTAHLPSSAVPEGYLDTKSDLKRQLPNTVLEAELAQTNPDVVLALGKDPWKFFNRPDADLSPVDSESISINDIDTNHRYKLQGRVFEYTGETASTHVIPLLFPKQDWPTRYYKIAETSDEAEQKERFPDQKQAADVTYERLKKSLVSIA